MSHLPQEKVVNVLFQQWVEEYTDALYAWALHKTSDSPLAEDLVQETFLAAYKSYHTFRQDSNPKTWLIAILNNKITDHYRKSGRNPISVASDFSATYEHIIESRFDENGRWKKEYEPTDWPSEGHLLDNAEFNQVLSHCMDELPEQWNKAVVLKYLDGANGASISQELGITSSNYWQIMHRAKVFLRECLEKLWRNDKQ